MLVEKRETRYRVQWYYKLFEQTMRGMARDQRTGAMPSADSIHGSLLALGELLQHTGEFLLARYKEVVEAVFKYKDSKEKLIRRWVGAGWPGGLGCGWAQATWRGACVARGPAGN